MNGRDEVTLIGLDFGTTTSSAVIAKATLKASAITGRTEIAALREALRSEMTFTPRRGDALDIEAIERVMDGWLAAAEIDTDDITGGGAIITGLAARAPNAGDLVASIQRRVPDALIATANDPRHEAWLAFMGSARARSALSPGAPVLNLDVGGGTTSVALGKGGEVIATASLFVGARHVRVEPGTYRINALSAEARVVFEALGIAKGPSDTLSPHEVSAFLDAQTGAIEALIQGDHAFFSGGAGAALMDKEVRPPLDIANATITLSGGVGELCHQLRQGRSPPLTAYGDLGIDLARRLLQAPWLKAPAGVLVGEMSRATSLGLLLHATQLSGSTVYLPRPERLPLRDIPILGTMSGASTAEELRALLDRAARCPGGSALRLTLEGPLGPAAERAVAALSPALEEMSFPWDRPLVLLVEQNAGKFLGHRVTRWGRRPLDIIVLDQISIPEAQFLHVGRSREGLVPVSFHGMW